MPAWLTTALAVWGAVLSTYAVLVEWRKRRPKILVGVRRTGAFDDAGGWRPLIEVRLTNVGERTAGVATVSLSTAEHDTLIIAMCDPPMTEWPLFVDPGHTTIVTFDAPPEPVVAAMAWDTTGRYHRGSDYRVVDVRESLGKVRWKWHSWWVGRMRKGHARRERRLAEAMASAASPTTDADTPIAPDEADRDTV